MKFFAAVFFSLLVHGGLLCAFALLAGGTAIVPARAPSVEISSVELSFASEDGTLPEINPFPPDNAPLPPLPETSAPSPLQEAADAPPLKAEPPVKADSGEIALPEPAPERPSLPPAQIVETAPSSLGQAKVDAPARPVAPIRPRYPESSRRRGEEGTVEVEVAINASGRVDSVSVVSSSGYAALDAAARDAVARTKFVPAADGDRNVSSLARLKVAFVLKDGGIR